MTTRITGRNYIGPINEVLRGNSTEILLGLNAVGTNIRVSFIDTPAGTDWSLKDGVPLVFLRDGDYQMPVRAPGDTFRGGEGMSLTFKNPMHPKNDIRVEFSSRERSR